MQPIPGELRKQLNLGPTLPIASQKFRTCHDFFKAQTFMEQFAVYTYLFPFEKEWIHLLNTFQGVVFFINHFPTV